MIALELSLYFAQQRYGIKVLSVVRDFEIFAAYPVVYGSKYFDVNEFW